MRSRRTIKDFGVPVPKMFCQEDRCPQFAEAHSYRCTAHRKENVNAWNKTQRDPSVKAFYASAEWKRLRERKLQANPVCELCDDQPATQVHHVIKAADDITRRLDMTNLQSTCASCHGKESAKERKGGQVNLGGV
jgi:5-methylcytosine-specific restriction endonuclease McrA